MKGTLKLTVAAVAAYFGNDKPLRRLMETKERGEFNAERIALLQLFLVGVDQLSRH